MNGKFGLITAVLLLLIIILAACAPAQTEEPAASGVQVIASGTVVPPTMAPIKVNLSDMGEAPEILNDVWINTEEPVTLASVQGKVVLLEFWTFG